MQSHLKTQPLSTLAILYNPIARVESSRDEASLGENASKQERGIDAIDVDADITLVNDADNEMFDADLLGSEEMFVEGQDKTVTTKELTLAQALEALKTSKPKAKEKATLFQQLLEKRRKHFTTNRAEKKRNKPPTQAQQRKIMCTYLKNMKGYTLKQLKSFEFDRIQEMFNKAFRRVNTFEDFGTELVKGKEKRAGEELIQESTEKQKSTRPMEDLDLLLWGGLKTMLEPHVEDKVYMLVEKTYPVTPPTLSMMLDKKLQIDYQSEMAYQLLKLIKK
nr:hypothetical protein [Tanacetum cinerariifolium]